MRKAVGFSSTKGLFLREDEGETVGVISLGIIPKVVQN